MRSIYVFAQISCVGYAYKSSIKRLTLPLTKSRAKNTAHVYINLDLRYFFSRFGVEQVGEGVEKGIEVEWERRKSDGMGIGGCRRD